MFLFLNADTLLLLFNFLIISFESLGLIFALFPVSGGGITVPLAAHSDVYELLKLNLVADLRSTFFSARLALAFMRYLILLSVGEIPFGLRDISSFILL